MGSFCFRIWIGPNCRRFGEDVRAGTIGTYSMMINDKQLVIRLGAPPTS
jgi:hypothetical protein